MTAEIADPELSGCVMLSAALRCYADQNWQAECGDGTAWQRRPIWTQFLQSAHAGIAPFFAIHDRLELYLGTTPMEVAFQRSRHQTVNPEIGPFVDSAACVILSSSIASAQATADLQGRMCICC